MWTVGDRRRPYALRWKDPLPDLIENEYGPQFHTPATKGRPGRKLRIMLLHTGGTDIPVNRTGSLPWYSFHLSSNRIARVSRRPTLQSLMDIGSKMGKNVMDQNGVETLATIYSGHVYVVAQRLSQENPPDPNNVYHVQDDDALEDSLEVAEQALGPELPTVVIFWKMHGISYASDEIQLPQGNSPTPPLRPFHTFSDSDSDAPSPTAKREGKRPYIPRNIRAQIAAAGEGPGSLGEVSCDNQRRKQTNRCNALKPVEKHDVKEVAAKKTGFVDVEVPPVCPFNQCGEPANRCKNSPEKRKRDSIDLDDGEESEASRKVVRVDTSEEMDTIATEGKSDAADGNESDLSEHGSVSDTDPLKKLLGGGESALSPRRGKGKGRGRKKRDDPVDSENVVGAGDFVRRSARNWNKNAWG
jgi:hypothetical protein